MTVAVIDYGSGNLRSAAKALERASTSGGRAHDIVVTSEARDLAAASHIVLPGVGAFGDCIAGLEALAGMCEALEREVREVGKPFLGICVGMQLMAERGIEHGEHRGLGWIAGEVLPLAPNGLRVPHMGWNELELRAEGHKALVGLHQGDHVYFVHSNVLVCRDRSDIAAVADYGGPVTSIVIRDNMIGTQFHPEKSQRAGLAFLRGFLDWRP